MSSLTSKLPENSVFRVMLKIPGSTGEAYLGYNAVTMACGVAKYTYRLLSVSVFTVTVRLTGKSRLPVYPLERQTILVEVVESTWQLDPSGSVMLIVLPSVKEAGKLEPAIVRVFSPWLFKCVEGFTDVTESLTRTLGTPG